MTSRSMAQTGRSRSTPKTSKDWKITFVDAGLYSNIGQRLLRAKKYLQGEDRFLANYADGLSDVPVDRQIAEFRAADAHR